MTSNNPHYSQGSAASHGYAACETCMHLSPIEADRCEYCDKRLHPRIPNSIQKSVALLIAALIMYIPANVYPIMTTTVLGKPHDSTILSGVWLFLQLGDVFVAMVIFIASVIIPLAKIIAVFWLCYNASTHRLRSDKQLTHVYRVTEFIGKWSMVDVFVVAITAALAQLGSVVNIKAGTAALAFAFVVILSMFAAMIVDTRLIWDLSDSKQRND